MDKFKGAPTIGALLQASRLRFPCASQNCVTERIYSQSVSELSDKPILMKSTRKRFTRSVSRLSGTSRLMKTAHDAHGLPTVANPPPSKKERATEKAQPRSRASKNQQVQKRIGQRPYSIFSEWWKPHHMTRHYIPTILYHVGLTHVVRP